MIRVIAESKAKTFVAALLAFGLGVLVYSFVPMRWPLVFGVGVVALFAFFLVWKKPVARLAALIFLFFVLGMFRFSLSEKFILQAGVNERIGEIASVRGVTGALHFSP